MGDDPDGAADLLMVTRAQGCAMVHLRVRALGVSAHTLCDVPTRQRPPSRLFQQSGCPECARVAVAAGIGFVREGPQVWVNLRRLASRPPA
ncbi:MAG: hypothetical protein QOK15_3574 [Nocardioidaceae bacterium]|jgi:hypothetical protein|nr:hypothetical protein [Nocardioidaceae bacterium]